MNAVYLLQNLKIRIALSWITIRYLPQLFEYKVELLPLVILTVVSTISIGLFFREKAEIGTPLEDTAFTPIDARSPRIEDDILANTKHLEIVISSKGVNTNL